MRSIRTSLVFAAVGLGLFAGQARAQETVAVKIPFSFVVNGKEMPAGQYDIRPVDEEGFVVLLEDTNLQSTMIVSTISADGYDPAGDQPALIFTRQNNGYRLSQIWKSERGGREIPASSADRREARTNAGHEPDDVQVVAAVRK
jgi:hypothetical protein